MVAFREDTNEGAIRRLRELVATGEGPVDTAQLLADIGRLLGELDHARAHAQTWYAAFEARRLDLSRLEELLETVRGQQEARLRLRAAEIEARAADGEVERVAFRLSDYGRRGYARVDDPAGRARVLVDGASDAAVLPLAPVPLLEDAEGEDTGGAA